MTKSEIAIITGAGKGVTIGLSESLYRELTAQGIKVTALCPGSCVKEIILEAPRSIR